MKDSSTITNVTGNDLGKTMNVNRLLNYFLLTFIVFFGGSSYLLTSSRVGNVMRLSYEERVKEMGQVQASMLRTDLNNHARVLEDHAKLPLVVSAVMNPNQDLSRLKDYLASISILGAKPTTWLLDFSGNTIATSRDGEDFDHQSFWCLHDILSGNLKSHTTLHRSSLGIYFWKLVVPVRYNSIPEGFLVAEIPLDHFQEFFQYIENRQEKMTIYTQNGVQVMQFGEIIQKPVSGSVDIPDLGISLYYEIEGLGAEEIKKKLIMQLLLLSIFTAILFGIIFKLIGKKLFVIPQTKLQLLAQKLQSALNTVEEERNRCDTIMNSMRDGLVVTDHEKRIVSLNHVAEKIFRTSKELSVDRLVTDLGGDRQILAGFEEAHKAENGRHSFDFELYGDNQDDKRVMRVRSSEVKISNRHQPGILSIIYDITREYEIDQMKTEFVATAAHELRTPLTVIQGFSELLIKRDAFSAGKQEEYLGYINQQAKSLAVIINDILDLSRIETGKAFKTNIKAGRLGETMREIVSLYQIKSQIHTFELDLPNEDTELLFDNEKITQVFNNLLSNAIKFSPDGGPVWVKGEVCEGYYQVSVRDEGPGIPSNKRDSVFEKFHRLDSTNAAQSGIGLGLSIVRHVIDAHGGKVWLESEVGIGTTVYFTLPVFIGGKDEELP